jgi:glycosyltransferase involved in cell wall biosynthesis
MAILESLDLSSVTASREPRILAMANGDPHDPRTASGVSSHLFGSFRRRGHLAGAVSSLPSKLSDLVVRARSVAPSKSAWRSRYRLSMSMARAFERAAADAFAARGEIEYDAFFQIGAYCDVSNVIKRPIFTYHDNDVLTMVRLDPRMCETDPNAGYVRDRVSYEKRVFDSAARIFTFSEWCAGHIASNYDVRADRIEVVGAGANIDVDLLAGERDYGAQHALFIGVDFERKGGLDVLEAFARVRKQLPSARLTIVGRHAAGEIAPGVTSLGLVHGADALSAVIRSASLFVMPSVWEPFGIVFLEAMAAGIPCIGSTACAMPEIIGETGSVVPPGNVGRLAGVMYSYLSDDALCADRGRAARERYQQNYGWDRVGERIIAAMKNHT